MKEYRKARDLIKGWPRPRTCFSAYDVNRLNPDLFFLGLKLRIPFAATLSEYKQHQVDVKKARAEFEFESTYHQMQQAMVNEWFARYRLGDKPFKINERRVSVGELLEPTGEVIHAIDADGKEVELIALRVKEIKRARNKR